jgi:hypothetical protein
MFNVQLWIKECWMSISFSSGTDSLKRYQLLNSDWSDTESFWVLELKFTRPCISSALERRLVMYTFISSALERRLVMYTFIFWALERRLFAGPIGLLLERTTLGEFLTAVENVRARSEAELQVSPPGPPSPPHHLPGSFSGYPSTSGLHNNIFVNSGMKYFLIAEMVTWVRGSSPYFNKKLFVARKILNKLLDVCIDC